MKRMLIVTTPLLLLLGCAGTLPPTQQMVDAQAASRSALELGAQRNPQAQLHYKLAEEQIAEAREAMADDENERATSLLIRAKADAELAMALSREAAAKQQVQQAREQAKLEHGTKPARGKR